MRFDRTNDNNPKNRAADNGPDSLGFHAESSVAAKRARPCFAYPRTRRNRLTRDTINYDRSVVLQYGFRTEPNGFSRASVEKKKNK